jgi:flavin reductase (DIM6/NTAB) family NADH-FMN oxidoreductase RutF
MRVPIPEGIKRHLRPLSQWTAIALDDPYAEVTVKLYCAEREFDVTQSNVVAALRPLTLAIGMDAIIEAAMESDFSPELRFIDRQTRAAIGTLHIRRTGTVTEGGVRLALFEISEGQHRCVAWPYRSWNTWLQTRAARGNTDPNNFSMLPEAIQQTAIFYTCPRPVVLVSVDDGSHSNIFPMDLIGPMGADRFTLALRSTSQSVPTMRTFRKIAISNIAGCDHQIAYKLGAHHKNVQVAWDALPFKTFRSQQFSLRVPDIALRVRELEVLHSQEIGSHTFFVTRIVSDVRVKDAELFCHTGGIHQYFRVRQHRPFRLAS